jgi:rod shape-determining protein MreC
VGSLFRKHNRFILILVILILLLIVFNLAHSIFPGESWGQDLVIDILSPFFSGVDFVNDSLHDTLNVLFNYQDVKQKNSQLKHQIKKLEWKNQQLKEIAQENSRLRELLNFKKKEEIEIIGANVIGRSANNWSRIITINRGRKSGLEAKMLVVTYNGYLVGKIKKVTNYNAQVLLCNDSDFTIGGLVAREESREIGIINGMLNQEELLKMTKLPWDAKIKIEDKIITSGLSENYPKGILIGKVTEVNPEDYGLTRTAILKPFVDVNIFEEVLVITDF